MRVAFGIGIPREADAQNSRQYQTFSFCIFITAIDITIRRSNICRWSATIGNGTMIVVRADRITGKSEDRDGTHDECRAVLIETIEFGQTLIEIVGLEYS